MTVTLADDWGSYGEALRVAQEQLDWGTNPTEVEAAAQGLGDFDPAHVLVPLLGSKARRLRGLGRIGATRSPSNSPSTGAVRGGLIGA